jgi:hypothetical protein
MPLFMLYDLALWEVLHGPRFGQPIFDELGRTWVVGQYLGWNLPFVVASAVLFRIPSQRRGVLVPKRR